MSVAVDRTDAEERPSRIPGPLVVVTAGTLAGGILGLLIARSNDAERLSPAFALGAIIGLVVSLFIVAEWISSRRYRLVRTIPLDPGAVQVHAARWFGGPPWSLSRQQPGELVFWRRIEPNLLTALLLFALGFIPGIIYMITSRGTQTLALGIGPNPDGTDLEILVQPQGHDGRRAINRFFNSLHDL